MSIGIPTDKLLLQCCGHKLSPEFFGPCKVLEKIGEVAFETELPPQAAIHPIFHVSQLKKKLGKSQVLQIHPAHYEEEIIEEPESILERRTFKHKNRVFSQVLIKWKQRTVEEATWEDYWSLIGRFPTFDNGGKPEINGGGPAND